MTSPTPDATPERRTLRARVTALVAHGFAALRHNRLLALVLACGLSIIGLSGLSVLYYVCCAAGVQLDADRTLARALAAIKSGQREVASEAVRQLQLIVQDDTTKRGYLPFVLGTIAAREAAQCGPGSDRETLYLVAARYLEEARICGFPPSYREQGLYRLATSLFQSGRYDESLPVLCAAWEQLPQHRHELARALATAYRDATVPNLNEALRYEQLASEDPSWTSRERDESLLRQSQIMFSLGDLAGCRAALAAVASDSPLHTQALIMEARVLIRENDQLRVDAAGQGANAPQVPVDRYRQAQEVLARVSEQDPTDITVRQARYLTGVIQRACGELPAATKTLRAVRHQYYGTDEALAAGLEEAEIHQSQGRADAARDLYLYVIEQATSADDRDNLWVPLADLCGRLHRAQHGFQVADQHAAAAALCAVGGPIFPPAELAEMEAQTHESWGYRLVREAAGRRNLQNAAVQADGRAHLRLAAAAYHRLATLRYATQHYPDDLWKCGECFVRGQNYEAALEVLEQYLQTAPRRQHPQALVAQGECHLALGNYHQALQVLDQCLQHYPTHPESYRARILASQTCVQLNRLAQAKQLLTDNLHQTELSPRSLQWQSSLFLYGQLVFREALAQEATSRLQGLDSQDESARQQGLDLLHAAQALYLEAIEHLEEAVQRYPDAAATNSAWYTIAESYRHAARLPSRGMQVESAAAGRHALDQQRRAYLAAAASAYQQLQARLLQAEAQDMLSATEQAMLRNTYFAHADVQFELEDYEQAISAYLAATDRYQQEPASLEAFMQLASCYRLLNAPAEAHRALLQAQATLERMRPDAAFTQTTRYNRDEWNEIISWLAQL